MRPYDEPWFPMDEDSYKMKRMQSQINRMTEKHGQRPVQFVDPFDDMFGTAKEGDDEDDGGGDYWARMMESMGVNICLARLRVRGRSASKTYCEVATLLR